MERLTERYDDGEAFCDKFSVVDDVGVNETILKGELIDKLADYEDAEEQGFLLRLPCKVGDTLYLPYSRPRYIKEVMVTDFMFNGCDLHILTDFVTLGNRDIGKTVFLTKEKAEQALKQMGE